MRARDRDCDSCLCCPAGLCPASWPLPLLKAGVRPVQQQYEATNVLPPPIPMPGAASTARARQVHSGAGPAAGPTAGDGMASQAADEAAGGLGDGAGAAGEEATGLAAEQAGTAGAKRRADEEPGAALVRLGCVELPLILRSRPASLHRFFSRQG
jgi:hypothetical protein